MTINLKSKQIRGLKKGEKSQTSDNTATELKRIKTDAQKEDPEENRIGLKAPGMTYKLGGGSKEDDKKLKQTCDNTLEIRCKEMERNRKDKPERKKQTTEHQQEQNATEIMKSEEKSGDREEEIEPTAYLCENSTEQNEAEIKSKETNGDREDEIELKNQVEQTEAEIKSEEKGGDREEEIEVKALLCENSVEHNEAEMKGKRRVVTGKKK